jgi:hypothetical protein
MLIIYGAGSLSSPRMLFSETDGCQVAAMLVSRREIGYNRETHPAQESARDSLESLGSFDPGPATSPTLGEEPNLDSRTEGSSVRSVEVSVTIGVPRDVVLREISEYTHPPVLHKGRIESVQVLEDVDNVSLALWRIKVLGFVRQAKQRQTVIPPDRMTNETIGGFARGTVESTFLYETSEGTRIVDRVDVRVPKWGKLLEWPVAWYTKRLAWGILMDHKRDLESRYGASSA